MSYFTPVYIVVGIVIVALSTHFITQTMETQNKPVKNVDLSAKMFNNLNTQHNLEKYKKMVEKLNESEQDLPQVIRHDGKTLYSSDDRHTSFEFFPSTKKSNNMLIVGWDNQSTSLNFQDQSMKDVNIRVLCPFKQLSEVAKSLPTTQTTPYDDLNVNLIHHELASFTPSTSNTLFLNTDSLQPMEVLEIIKRNPETLDYIIVKYNENNYKQIRTKLVHHNYQKVSMNSNDYITFAKSV